jgi:acyl-CoA synthetase (AMP-forming)/AMP-acid ligase II
MTSPLLTLLSADSIKRNYASGFWRDETIYDVAAAHARRAPNRIAVDDSYRSLSFGELIAAAIALANDLTGRGVRPGERVLTWLPDRIESVLALLACSRAGFVFCPSPHRNHAVADVIRLVERTRAAAFIYQTDFGADGARSDIAVELAALPWLRHVCRLDPNGPVPSPLLACGAKLPDDTVKSAAETDPNSVVYLAFTSGSSGLPKGVMHSDNTLLATARAIAADWHLDEQTVTCSLSPFNHNLGLGTLITSLYCGGKFVINDLPRGGSVIDRLAATGTNYLVGVPTHAIDLVDELRRRGGTGLEKLRGFRISGAAVPAPVVAELLRYKVLPQCGYGMTETCAHQYTLPDEDEKLIIETSGKACPGYDLRIWDANDRDLELPPGEIGELGGRGASLMLGYFGDQAATENAFNRHGYFMTGDLGRLDRNGYLRITGRKKDVIIRGGHNINPARIEDIVMRHEAIERAAAIPVADARLGEKLCLAVMFHAGRSVSVEQILDHLGVAGLSKYEMPEFFLELPDIPLMPNGKIEKLEIVKWVLDGTVQPAPVGRQAGD